MILRTGLAVLCALVLISPVAADEVDDYQDSWIHRALSIQRELDMDIPIDIYLTLYKSKLISI